MSQHFWNIENLRKTVHGQWMYRPTEAPEDESIFGICIDSRELEPGQIFCALQGLHSDGHQYLNQAMKNGAGLLLINDAESFETIQNPECPVLLVDDTFEALRKLTLAYRRTLSGKIIAITGSVGKTTTKNILQSLLSSRFRGSASPKSYNNHIGVPLTLLNAEHASQYVICEVGTNHPGEIASLAALVEPDIAVITAVGRSHLEFFDGVEAVAVEKASLLSHLKEDGLAILNGEVELLKPYYKILKRYHTYGHHEACHLRITDLSSDATGIQFTVNDRHQFTLPMLGEHNAMNAMAAIAVSRALGMTDEQITQAMLKVTPPPMRLAIQQVQKMTIINDAYNANPESMQAALKVAMEYPGPQRKVLLLGDMLELGDVSEELHIQLGKAVAKMNADLILFVGEESQCSFQACQNTTEAPSCYHFENTSEELMEFLSKELRPDDLILLKASRGIALEQCLSTLQSIAEKR